MLWVQILIYLKYYDPNPLFNKILDTISINLIYSLCIIYTFFIKYFTFFIKYFMDKKPYLDFRFFNPNFLNELKYEYSGLNRLNIIRNGSSF